MIRELIGLEVTDLIRVTDAEISAAGVQSVEALQLLPHNVVHPTPGLAQANRALKSFLFHHLYQHYQVVRMQVKAERIVEGLFQAYCRNPQILPDEVQQRARQQSLERTVCDYIAGMTDRFALQEHGRLFDPQILP
jgi:dGTPase